MKARAIILVIPAIMMLASCQPKFDTQITTEELKEEISFLASDSLKGRFPGTIEDSVLAVYISKKLDEAGMLLFEDTGIQTFPVNRGYEYGENNKLSLNKNPLVYGTDFLVPGFSASASLEGTPLLLSTSETDVPEGSITVLPLLSDLPQNAYDAYSVLRSAALKIADLGTAAVIYYTSTDLPELSHPLQSPLRIPVMIIREASMPALKGSLEKSSIQLQTEIFPGEIKTFNSISTLKGSDSELSGEYIVIGAHHDHLGLGGKGSSSRMQDTIAPHYGADDNASGVAGVIELAQNIMSRSPSRSFLFTTFGAEEMGLYGSKFFNENSPVAHESMQAMINLDMIGRLKENRQLQIGGIGTSPVFRAILDSINEAYNFEIAYSEAGFGPSDHSSFYAKDVPVLFISTGAHKDYHTPADSEDKLNYEGMVAVLNYVSDVAMVLANMPEKLEFTMAGPKESSGSRGRYGGVTFGLMPDMMYDGNEGMPVTAVTEGKPAAIAGMKDGDIIKFVDGKYVGNIHDYMERLGELKEGQSVVVGVTRDGKDLELLLKL